MSPLRKQLIQQMQLEGYCKRTIKSYVSIIAQIASFYNTPADQLSVIQIRDFILKREWNRIDLPRPRKDQKVVVILSRDEVQRIINSKTNLKHRAILIVIYSAGLRRCEVSNLKITDIDSSRMLIHLHTTKGNKERYTILSPVALDALKNCRTSAMGSHP